MNLVHINTLECELNLPASCCIISDIIWHHNVRSVGSCCTTRHMHTMGYHLLSGCVESMECGILSSYLTCHIVPVLKNILSKLNLVLRESEFAKMLRDLSLLVLAGLFCLALGKWVCVWHEFIQSMLVMDVFAFYLSGAVPIIPGNVITVESKKVCGWAC